MTMPDIDTEDRMHVVSRKIIVCNTSKELLAALDVFPDGTPPNHTHVTRHCPADPEHAVFPCVVVMTHFAREFDRRTDSDIVVLPYETLREHFWTARPCDPPYALHQPKPRACFVCGKDMTKLYLNRVYFPSCGSQRCEMKMQGGVDAHEHGANRCASTTPCTV